MIAFLPIARYRVEYQVASGRPFSTFEKLLLRAVQGGEDSLSALANRFEVHRRLIVEGVVTLMQAGWVSLGAANSEFVLTSSGQKACGDSVGLPPTIIVADRQQTVVVEKVTGQVARSNELDFYSRAKLRPLWHEGVALRKRDVSNVVDSGLVAPLLPHQPTEWIRWIGPISVLSDDAAFTVIDVNVIAERITGIPRAWEALLLPECIDQVRRREKELAAGGIEIKDEELRKFVRGVGELPDADDEALDRDLSWTNVPLGVDDVLKSDSDHQNAIMSLFSEAVSYIAIATPTLGAEAVRLLPLLKAAMGRGLLVNIMLGEMPNRNVKGSWELFEALKKLEYDSARALTGGRLVLGGRQTECSTSIVLADSVSGATAIVGSYQWTAPPVGEALHVSMRIRGTWIVARLAEILGSFSALDEKLRLGSGFVRLKKVAGGLRQQAQKAEPDRSSNGASVVRLILERDHRQAMLWATAEAQHSITVFTSDLERFSNAGLLHLLLAPSERLGCNIKLIHGAPLVLDGNRIPEIGQLLKHGVTIEYAEGLGTDLVLADSDHSVLFGDRSGEAIYGQQRLYASRIGVVIKGSLASSIFPKG